jgi:hypothetical protein
MADQYGCMRADSREDAMEVWEALDRAGSAVFALSGDQVGAMVIFVSRVFEKLGVMPFGGNPHGRAYVGVLKRGCGHLSMQDTHPSYIGEQLNLTGDDAETFAKFWALIFEPKE